ncbi:hypothetical protein KKB10_03905 [Patescibacteria group bacterium]|nr:hypothetical protein [Patescibacteria group bacterium]MBU1951917.1 hypothetical protein [Patescibacteria group bacterium]
MDKEHLEELHAKTKAYVDYDKEFHDYLSQYVKWGDAPLTDIPKPITRESHEEYKKMKSKLEKLELEWMECLRRDVNN